MIRLLMATTHLTLTLKSHTQGERETSGQRAQQVILRRKMKDVEMARIRQALTNVFPSLSSRPLEALLTWLRR